MALVAGSYRYCACAHLGGGRLKYGQFVVRIFPRSLRLRRVFGLRCQSAAAVVAGSDSRSSIPRDCGLQHLSEPQTGDSLDPGCVCSALDQQRIRRRVFIGDCGDTSSRGGIIFRRGKAVFKD